MNQEIEPFIVASRARDLLEPSRRGPCYGRMRQKLEIKVGGYSNTISTVSKDNYLVLPAVLKAQRAEYGRAIRKQYDNHKVSLKRQDIREWVPRKDYISNIISTVTKDNIVMTQNKTRKHGIPAEMLHLDNMPAELNGKKVYIRKLTPRECFRLMDVSEEDIDKMMLPKDDRGKPVISNSQLYKLAGNSIVVSNLEFIFHNLLFGPFERDTGMKGEELPLFKDL